VYHVMLKYIVTRVSRYAEIYSYSCITLCWNIYLLVYRAMLKYMFSPVIRYSEITVFCSCTLYWNIWFLIYYVMLKMSAFLCIALCWTICFLVYYVMVKYLVSHLMYNAKISDFSCNTFGWNIFFSCNILY
jgi:hypothetical protein